MKKTILFDMDGTLIDSEKFYRISWIKAANYFGFTMTDRQELDMRSLGQPFALERIREMFGPEADYQLLRAKRNEYMNELIEKNGLKAQPYAKEALQLLKDQGYTLAITTASPFQRAQSYLQQAKLIDYFDELICSTMVKQGKPAPDTYLYALEKLHLSPQETIAVEDSDNGVLSAYGAGIPTALIIDLAPLKPENQHCVIAQYDNLWQFANDIIKKDKA